MKMVDDKLNFLLGLTHICQPKKQKKMKKLLLVWTWTAIGSFRQWLGFLLAIELLELEL